MSTKSKIQIAMVDDHQIVIDGISALLIQDEDLQIVITANNGTDMLALLTQHNIDILLTDVVMEGMSGQQLAKQVRKQFPAIKIIALSMSGVGEIVDEMINDADISGYLLKQTGKQELVNAIKKVYNGGQYFQPQILDELSKHENIKVQLNAAHLTNREIEIVQLFEKGLSNNDIAEKLFLSVHTIETHRKNMFRKTETTTLLALIKWAYEHRIIAR
jgi:two-component system, NarL family, nitrate/nitrite response regulator NarL